MNVLIPSRNRAEPGYCFNPAVVTRYLEHELLLRIQPLDDPDAAERRFITHSFAVVRYLKPPSADRDGLAHRPPGNLSRMSKSKYPYSVSGCNIVPVHLLFTRFFPFNESVGNCIVIPIARKWISGNSILIKPKRF